MSAIDPAVKFPKRVQDDGSWIQTPYNRMHPSPQAWLPPIYGTEHFTSVNKIGEFPHYAKFGGGTTYTAPDALSEGKIRAGDDARFNFPISRGRLPQ